MAEMDYAAESEAPREAPEQPLLLIDLASLVHPLWHLCSTEPDPNATSVKAIARVHALTNSRAHVAICTDSRKSFRKELTPTYKANRPAQDEPLRHQMRLAEDALKTDGFPVWKVDGFEADDLIASAAQQAFERDLPVLIASSDKDLLQLVSNACRVQVVSLTNGTLYDENAVALKFGVEPNQILDYLTMVGDASDNIKGIAKVGPKTAADLLRRYKTLDAIVAAAKMNAEDITPAVKLNIATATEAIALGRQLITLRADVPLPFDEIFQPRISQQNEDAMSENVDDITPGAESVSEPQVLPDAPKPNGRALTTGPLVTVESGAWGRQLEPRSLDDARTIAKWLHTSRLFAAYGSPEAIFSIVLAGRELGIGTMASLRGFHIVQGRPTMAADLMRALVMSSGKAEYFMCIERTAASSTWETKRKGDPAPTRVTYTLDEAKTAGLVKSGGGWANHPADMTAKTASSKLARLVYADVTFGLYCPEELGGEEV